LDQKLSVSSSKQHLTYFRSRILNLCYKVVINFISRLRKNS